MKVAYGYNDILSGGICVVLVYTHEVILESYASLVRFYGSQFEWFQSAEPAGVLARVYCTAAVHLMHCVSDYIH